MATSPRCCDGEGKRQARAEGASPGQPCDRRLTRHYVSGWMRGSHNGPLNAVRARRRPPSAVRRSSAGGTDGLPVRGRQTRRPARRVRRCLVWTARGRGRWRWPTTCAATARSSLAGCRWRTWRTRRRPRRRADARPLGADRGTGPVSRTPVSGRPSSDPSASARPRGRACGVCRRSLPGAGAALPVSPLLAQALGIRD
jgi:hypothetical protein